ncbi:zincin, partial [Anaeromyces robustus]
PRTQICLKTTNNVMAEAVGKLYVDKYFTPDKKQYSEKVIEYIKQSMINRIPQVEWLDDETIEYAYKKVSAMTETIGYNEKIMNPEYLYEKYEKQGVDENDYITTIINYYKYSNKKTLKYAVSNLSEIDMDIPPQIVNAYYNFYQNSMTVLAGILQPPFFSSEYPDYINYGGIGSIIGHELTHAFDNTGKNFDMNGKSFNWWTENDLEEYEELTKCFIDQYVFIYKTLNENIADNGGLARAYESWKQSLKEDPETVKKQNQKLPGLTKYTPDQLFFILYGYMWCMNVDDPSTIDYMLSIDVHSEGNVRVNGVITNSNYFAKAFNCPLNSKMNPEKKCVIW